MTLYIGDKPVGLMRVVKDTKYIDKTKYGVSIDNILGDVDENGVLQKSSAPIQFDGTGIKEIGMDSLAYVFAEYNNKRTPQEVHLGDLEVVQQRGLAYAFANTDSSANGSLQSIDLNSVKEVELYAMYGTFSNQKNLKGHINLSNLESIGNGGMLSCFESCGITSISLDNLKTVGNNGLQKCFSKTKLESLYFPSLISTSSDMFSSFTSSTGMLYQCTTITEIHFRADMQSTIEAQTGYSKKFGAPATCEIFFDL